VSSCDPTRSRFLERRRAEGERVSIQVGLLGYGGVGRAVAELAGADPSPLSSAGVTVRCTRALVRDPDKLRTGPPLLLTRSAADVVDDDVDAVVEVMGGVDPARTLVAAVLRRGIPVVSANKTLVAHHGRELSELARRHRTVFAYEAAALAGVPLLGALARRPLLAAPARITGILNGTSHFVLSTMASGATLEQALADAISRGYAERDSGADLGGRDAAEKLTILLHLCGRSGARVGDLVVRSIADLCAADLAGARLLTGTIKPVALASLHAGRAGSWVGPAFVPAGHAFAGLAGVDNAVRLSPTAGDPVTFVGPGAGPHVTAATILDDVVDAVGRRNAGGRCHAGWQGAGDASDLRRPPSGRWFLRIGRAPAMPAREAALSLAADGLLVERLIAHEGRVYALLGPAAPDLIAGARARLTSAGASVLALPVLED
jgi:homoserine dehydrogenase